MERLTNVIAQKCLQLELIDEDQKEWLLYLLQCRIINVVGFSVLIGLGLLIAPFSEVLVLNLGLVFLRKRTNGLHVSTKLACFSVSLLCEWLCLCGIQQLPADISIVAVGLLIVSSVIILWLAPCNNKEIHLSRSELEKYRRAVRARLTIYVVVVFVLFVLDPSLANTLIVAEAMVALLVILAKLGAGIR